MSQITNHEIEDTFGVAVALLFDSYHAEAEYTGKRKYRQEQCGGCLKFGCFEKFSCFSETPLIFLFTGPQFYKSQIIAVIKAIKEGLRRSKRGQCSVHI